MRASETLDVTALSPRAELEAFIERIVPLQAISRRMLKSRTFGYVTAALPGLEAFLMLERLRALAGQAALDDRYVVIDAPATGTALDCSRSRAASGIAPFGTLNRLAGEVESFLADPNRFGVVLTLTPEELALREALEAAAALRRRSVSQRVAAIAQRGSGRAFRGRRSWRPLRDSPSMPRWPRGGSRPTPCGARPQANSSAAACA